MNKEHARLIVLTLVTLAIIGLVAAVIANIPNPGHDLVDIRGDRLYTVQDSGGYFWILKPLSRESGQTYQGVDSPLIGINGANGQVHIGNSFMASLGTNAGGLLNIHGKTVGTGDICTLVGGTEKCLSTATTGGGSAARVPVAATENFLIDVLGIAYLPDGGNYQVAFTLPLGSSPSVSGTCNLTIVNGEPKMRIRAVRISDGSEILNEQVQGAWIKRSVPTVSGGIICSLGVVNGGISAGPIPPVNELRYQPRACFFVGASGSFCWNGSEITP